jgi:hypothetical protein
MKKLSTIFISVVFVTAFLAFGFNNSFNVQHYGQESVMFQSQGTSVDSRAPWIKESFDGTTFPPTGWTATALGGGSYNWIRVTSTSHPSGYSTHSGAGMASFNCYSASNGSRAILVTPSFSLTSGQGQLSFWLFGDPGFSQPDSIGIYINTTPDTVNATFVANVSRYNTAYGWNQYNYSLPASFNGTTNYIVFKAWSLYGNDLYLDDVTYGVPDPMAYVSSTTTQVTGSVSRNSMNNAIISIPITMSGTLSPINITQLNFTTTGTTNPSVDISNAKVFYTGTSSSFSTATQFGSTVASPNGSFSISGTQTLSEGTNYFWLTYDIPSTGVLGDYIDATCPSIIGSGTMGTVVPTVTSPDGNRQISAWFSESFDNTTFPPSGWKDTAIVGTSYLWARSTAGTNPTCTPHSGAGMAYYNSYSSSSGNNCLLITPAFDLSGGQGAVKFWFYRDPGYSTTYDSIGVWLNTSPNMIGAIPLGNIWRYSATAGWYQFTYMLPASYNGTTNYIIFRAWSALGNNMFLDDVSWGTPDPMVYQSGITTQTSGAIAPNSTNNQIIGIQISTVGSGSPLSISQFNLTTTGSSNPTTDIRNAKIFYTGLSSTFATTTQYGSTVTNPNGLFNIAGTQTLSEGTNYFWLTYDIPAGAGIGDIVDATCEQIIGSGSMGTVVPVPTAPAGYKTVLGPMSGTYVVGVGQTSPNFPTLTNAFSDLLIRGVNGPVTLLVKPGIYGTDAGLEIDSTLTLNYIPGSSSTNKVTIKKKSDEVGDVWVERRGTTGTTDYIIGLNGAEYTIFDSINVRQKDTTSAYNMVEWGYYLTNSSATIGANNDIIRNCQISLKNTNSATNGIRQYMTYTPTMPSGTNSNNQFINNTIVNSYYGFYLYGYSASSPYNLNDLNTQVISNNLVNVGGTVASAAYGIYSYYQGNGYKILNNTISTASNHASSFYGIYPNYGYDANIDINGNTLNANYNVSSAYYGIYPYYAGAISSGTISNHLNINNNTFNIKLGSTFATTSYGIYPYYCYADSMNIKGNIFVNDSIPGTGTFYGIYPYYFGNNLDVSNNTFSNIYRISSGTTYFIYPYVSYYNKSNAKIYNNTISNIRSYSGSIYGIYSNQTITATAYIYNNNLNNLFTGSGSLIYGIYNTTVANSYVYNNKINNLKDSTYSSAVVYGIYAAGTTNNYYYNNFISNLKTPASSSNLGTVGIYLNSGVFNGIYNNSIYMADSSTSTSYGSAGVYVNGAYPFELRNNNIVNISKPGGLGNVNRTAGIRISSSANLTYLLGTSNYNNIRCSQTSDTTGRSLFFDGTNCDATLAAYKLRVSPREQSAVSEMPPFVNAAAGDLHLSTGVATLLNNTAATITSPFNVNTDIDGLTRGATFSDIGASEFAGTSATDIIPPTITYNALGNASSAARTLTNVVITDPSGIDGTNLPRLYYKKRAHANTFVDNTSATNGWKYVQGVLNSGQYTFTFDYTLLYSGGVSAGDTIQYFVNAQDLASVPNVGINAGAYTTTPTSVNLTAANFPILGTMNSYIILSASFGNTVYVGTGQTYTSLTKAGGLFYAINTGALSGNLNVIITSNLTEDGTYQLQNWSEQSSAPASYKITIKPDSAVVRNIYGWVSNTNGMIRLYGVNNVTIDGSFNGSGKYLRFANFKVGSGYPTIQLYGGCTYDTVKNCILEGNNSSTTSGILLIGAAYTTNPIQPNNYLVISGNLVSSRTDSLVATANYNGIINYGSAAPNLNSYNQIINNEVKNCSYYPIYVSATGSGDGWIIKKNSVYYLQDAYTPAYLGTTMYGIYVIPGVYGSGYTVDSNYVGGSQAYAGGTYMNIQGLYNGIYTSFGYTSQSSLSGNVVKNIRSTYITANTSIYYSIYCGSGWMNISGNYVGSTDASQRLEMNGCWRGIYAASPFVTGPATVTCNNNTIYNVWTRSDSTIATLTGSFYRYGMVLGGYLPTVASNNLIKNIFSWQNTGSTSYNNWTMGILPNVYNVTYVTNNIIDSICNLSTAAPTGAGRILVYGMQPIGMGDGSVFSGNRISHVFTSTQGGYGDLVMGIYNAASYYGSTVTLSNNQVTLLDNSGVYANVMGVIDVSGSYAGGVCNWYDNSIVVGGTSGGAYNSYAYYKSTSTGVPCYTNLNNNILYNMRTGGGVSHLAIGTYTGTKNAKESYPYAFDDENNKPVIKNNPLPSGNSPLFTSDYNYLVAPTASTIGDWYGTLGNMSFWQTNAGTDANSVWDTTAAVPAASFFRGYTAANLNIDTTSIKSLKIYKKGIGITGISTDFNGYPRATSGPVNIGSHEFNLTRPVNVSLISPANNAIDLYLPINMVWSKAIFATSYGLQISTDSTFATTLVNTSVSDSVYSFTTGTTKTKYYWRVLPIYPDASTGAYTAVWNFTTAPNSPNAPILISPANNAINQPYTNLIFNWTKAIETFDKSSGKSNNPVTDNLTGNNSKSATDNLKGSKTNSNIGSKSEPLTINKYWFELTTDSTFTTVTVRDSLLSDTTKTVASLTSNTNYWWRVKAKNQTGWGSFSTVFKFKTTLDPTFLAQANFISVICPKYMASGTSTRLPVAVRGTIQGLVPNKTYRYYNLFAASTDIGTSSLGAGIIMLINPSTGVFNYASTGSLTTAGSYGTFVADAAGTFTGWFGGLNSGNARFTAGNYLYPSIVIGDSVGTVISRYAMNDSILVLGFSTTAGLPNGTGVYGISYGLPKNFVSLYDNTAGTGKPLATTWLESDTITIPSVVAYYSSSVDNQNGRWGTILPNALTAGVQRVEQRSLTTGAVISYNTNATGIWPSGVNTINPTGGTTPLVMTTADAPLLNAPVLLTPTNGAVDLSLTPVMSWNVSATASGYRLQISSDSTFTTTQYDTTGLAATTITVPTGKLTTNNKYYWRVSATNIVGTSAWSTLWNFTTAPNAPNVPVLVQPANNAINQPTTITFKWNKAIETLVSSKGNNVRAIEKGDRTDNSSKVNNQEGMMTDNDKNISKYFFQLGTDSTFATSLVNDSTLTDTTKTLSSLSTNTKYYWRVRAKNQTGWSSFSAVWNFTTIPPVPGAPVLSEPANGETGVSLTPAMSWNSVQYASTYRLQISTDTLFTTPLWDTAGISGLTVTVPTGKLTYGVKYYWRVNASNASGTSSYSARWSFTTVTRPALSIKVFLEGFYKPTTGTQVNDTIKVYLADSTQSYAMVDSATIVLNDTGKATVSMNRITGGKYFIVIKHRNHLETWSKYAVNFTLGNSTVYDFTTAATQAYGNNMKQVGSVWVLFGGDANHDGDISALDIPIFTSQFGTQGYLAADFNGDGDVNGLDAAILVANFGLSRIIPAFDNVVVNPTPEVIKQKREEIQKQINDKIQQSKNKQWFDKNRNENKNKTGNNN